MVREGSFNIYNLSPRLIYIVSDLKGFTDELKNLNTFTIIKSVNPGSQKFRGSTSYLNNILSRLDKDFRDSMSNHHLLFFLETSKQK